MTASTANASQLQPRQVEFVGPMGGPLHNIIRPLHRDNHPRFRVSFTFLLCYSKFLISSHCNMLTMRPVALTLVDVDVPASVPATAPVGF